MDRRRQTRRRLNAVDSDNQRALRREAYQRNHASRAKAQQLYAAANRERLAKYKREQWAANREENHRKRAEYRKANKELIRTYQQRCYGRRREKHNAKMREYHARNREVLNAKRREWYEKAKSDPAFFHARKAYAKSLSDRTFFRSRAARLRFRSKSNGQCSKTGSDVTGRELWSIWKKQRGCCALTGEPLDRSAHIDHIVPMSRGGITTKANLRFLSPRANLIKRHHTDEELLDFCAAVIATIGGSHPRP